jgi:RNA ligase (TIGR02306 family)
MSNFECPVVRISIEAHPNADAIEIARVGDYQSIVKKGQFADGDLAVYIPEQAVVPENMLREMGMYDDFKGKGGLAGTMGNRVKAIKLRGVVSQGLIYPLEYSHSDAESYYFIPLEGNNSFVAVEEGEDVAEWLGITKYEPKIPSNMAGRVIGADFNATAKYDFENIKKQPSLFEEGELVVITEKIHGTLLQIGVVPSNMANEKFYKGRVVISSKGMGAKGLILDHNDETNIYAQTAVKHGLLDIMFDKFADGTDLFERPVFLFGEVYGVTKSGAGVQDLKYDGTEIGFRAFDLCNGNRGKEEFAPQEGFVYFCDDSGVPRVPVLYEGEYSKDKLLELTDGLTTLGGAHIREGVVVKSALETQHPKYGRKIAKSVSNAYLLRKGETSEFS